MRDWVTNLTVVLADGSVIKTRRRPRYERLLSICNIQSNTLLRKSSAGYNLNGILVGSEGTLGIVTEITLKLAVIPEETSVAVVPFPSIRAAANTASCIVQNGIQLQALEILDDVQMRVVNEIGQTGRQWKEQTTLFLKFAGTRTAVADEIQRVKSIARQNGGHDFKFASTAKEQHELWSARKQALWSMLALRGEQKGNEVWSTDVAVPLSRLADIIGKFLCSHGRSGKLTFYV